MRLIYRYSLLLLAIVSLSGCAAVFFPKSQKITINTRSEDAKVFIDNEKFGEGKSITNKVERGKSRQVVVLYGDDSAKVNDVLIPRSKRGHGYLVAQIFNGIFIPVYGMGLYALASDAKAKKVYPYEKVVDFNAAPDVTPKRSEDSKYIHLSKISVDIENTDDDFVYHNGSIKGGLENSMASAKADTKEADAKKAKKEAKRKKKDTEYLVEQKKTSN